APTPAAPPPDPRGEDFDISTLPANNGGIKNLFPPHWNKAWIAVAVALGLYIVWFLAYGMGARSQKPLPLPINTPAAPQSSTAAVPSTTVTVHVAGAVITPGVYSLPATARINDAINQAGGPTPDADTTNLNIADFVRDGAQIVVPTKAAPSTTTLPATAPQLPPTTNTTDTSTLSATPTATRSSTIDYFRAHPIDLNRASSFELQQLPGIGPSRARAIIDYRTANGLFRSVSDLDNVKGIGEKRMEVLKDLLVVR
ncbi:hypothetical protein EON83_23690, partial [bacterium]